MRKRESGEGEKIPIGAAGPAGRPGRRQPSRRPGEKKGVLGEKKGGRERKEGEEQEGGGEGGRGDGREPRRGGRRQRKHRAGPKAPPPPVPASRIAHVLLLKEYTRKREKFGESVRASERERVREIERLLINIRVVKKRH